MWRTAVIVSMLAAAMVATAGCAESAHGKQSANLHVFVSDAPNAIGDFSHLWVTVDSIGLHVASSSSDQSGWLTVDVPPSSNTMDLVGLSGDKAMQLIATDVPPGNYDQVFIHVSNVTGELQSGKTVPVKLPSSKLQMRKGFDLSGNGVTNFVFDLTVIAAGNDMHGVKYILQPVADQSGPNRPIAVVHPGPSKGGLDVSVSGSTATVTSKGQPVKGVQVTATAAFDATTSADGTLPLQLPAGIESMKVQAKAGNAQGQLSVTFAQDGTAHVVSGNVAGLLIAFESTPTPGSQATLIIKSADGGPVAGASVNISLSIDAGTTDAKGQVTLPPFPANANVSAQARQVGTHGETKENAKPPKPHGPGPGNQGKKSGGKGKGHGGQDHGPAGTQDATHD